MDGEIRQQIFDILREWSNNLIVDKHFEQVYVFGSFVYKDGTQFNGELSDIDLVLVFSSDLTTASSRTTACASLLLKIESLEYHLLKALKRKEADKAIVSVVAITPTELKFGVHKDGKSDFFSKSEFLRLDNGSKPNFTIETNVTFGNELDGVVAVIQETQKFRNQFLRTSANGARMVNNWDSSVDPIPKTILRAAAQLRYFVEDKTDQTEFDVNLGLQFLNYFLYTKIAEDTNFSELNEWLAIRLGGRGTRTSLAPDRHLLLWEALFERALQDLSIPSKSIFPPTTKVSFVERVNEQKNRNYTELFEEFFSSDRKQIGLIGEAGAGKSALAVETGKKLKKNHDFHFLWSSARGREDYSYISLMEDILIQLRVENKTVSKSSLLSALSKDKYFLVLDNFETIQKEEQEKCLAWVVNDAPFSTLITSLHRIKGISNVFIDSMTYEEAKILVEKLKEGVINPIKYSDEEILQQLETTNPLLLETAIEILDTRYDHQLSLADVLSVVKERIERVTDILSDEGKIVLQTLSLFGASTSKEILLKATNFEEENDLNIGLSELKQFGLLVEENNRISLKESQRRVLRVKNSKENL